MNRVFEVIVRLEVSRYVISGTRVPCLSHQGYGSIHVSVVTSDADKGEHIPAALVVLGRLLEPSLTLTELSPPPGGIVFNWNSSEGNHRTIHSLVTQKQKP